MPVPDPFRQGLDRGWITTTPHAWNTTCNCADIAVIGSGAGGATSTAAQRRGLQGLADRRGPLKTSSDFKLLEHEAMPASIRRAWGA